MSERSGELRIQCANYALPSLPTYPSLPEEQNYSPSTPSERSSTRERRSEVDGWTVADIFVTWNLLVSEGHCPDDSCRGRLRRLREDETAWLSEHRSGDCPGRCTRCGSFVYRDDDGQITGYSWSLYAPELVSA